MSVDSIDTQTAAEERAPSESTTASLPPERDLFVLVMPAIGLLAVVTILVLLVAGGDETRQAVQPPPPDESGVIVLETVSQTLGESIAFEGERDRYRLFLAEGTGVVVRMNAVGGERSGLDSELEVFDPIGNQAAYNDDSGGEGFAGPFPEEVGDDVDGLWSGFGLDSQVVFVAANAGDYVIEARGLGDCCRGEYTLTIEIDGVLPADGAGPVAPPVAEPVREPAITDDSLLVNP